MSQDGVVTAEAPSANEEAIRAWDTVLYERFRQYRHIFVTALAQFSEDAFRTDAPPAGARCLDLGCGFGDTTLRLAEIVGAEGSAHGVDSGERFIADARGAAEAEGLANVSFSVADVQAASFAPEYDYAFARMGTMFFANPVQGLRAIRGALKPGGKLCMIVWRRKDENQFARDPELVVERFLTHPDATDADTCGPGPFSMGNADTVTGIMKSAGFADTTLRRCDIDYLVGGNAREAIDVVMALGPAGELIRVNDEEGEAKRPEIASALEELISGWTVEDGRVIAGASAWIISALNPG
jgi:ubiquinone/menaquinone biosynthesis C-methylase UbiE